MCSVEHDLIRAKVEVLFHVDFFEAFVHAVTISLKLSFFFLSSTSQNKMQVDEDQQKAQDDGEKEDGEKKAETEAMEVVPSHQRWPTLFSAFRSVPSLSCAD